MYIPIILGTGRQGRQSEAVARYVHAHAQRAALFDTELLDVKDYAPQWTIPEWEENADAEKWRAIVERADGFIMVVPEYNSAYPGEFKLLLDQAFKKYAHKPVSLCAVSSGQYGGMRLHMHALALWKKLELVHVTTIHFPSIGTFFTPDGTPQDATMDERVRAMCTDMHAHAQLLSDYRNGK